MVVKKFKGTTENEAMLQVKEEMGSQAIVLNIKKIKRRGLMRFFKGDEVEVTAALGEEEENEKLQKHVNVAIDEDLSRNLSEVAAKVEKSVNESRQLEKQEKEKKEDVEKKTEKEEKSYEYMVKSGEGTIEEKLNNLQSMLEQRLAQKEEQQQEDTEPEEHKKFKNLLYNKLLDNGVEERYINQIMDEIYHSGMEDEPESVDVILANVYQKMILKFGPSAFVKPAEHGPKVMFFIGPTGVGKTTSIAKIASKLKLDQKKKIAMLTMDTYRIAAAEQLRIYSDILDTPFHVIYTSIELNDTIAKFMDYDYILVDTAGHSPNNIEHREDLVSVIRQVPEEFEKEIYLVVSATTKIEDLRNIADQYKKLGKYKLIFTKLDETTAWGNILNLRLYTDAEIAFLGNGQNVPDDIKTLDAQSIVRKLLGGK